MNHDEDLFKIVTLDIGKSIIKFSNNAKEMSICQKEYFPEIDFNQDELIYISINIFT